MKFFLARIWLRVAYLMLPHTYASMMHTTKHCLTWIFFAGPRWLGCIWYYEKHEVWCANPQSWNCCVHQVGIAILAQKHAEVSVISWSRQGICNWIYGSMVYILRWLWRLLVITSSRKHSECTSLSSWISEYIPARHVWPLFTNSCEQPVIWIYLFLCEYKQT